MVLFTWALLEAATHMRVQAPPLTAGHVARCMGTGASAAVPSDVRTCLHLWRGRVERVVRRSFWRGVARAPTTTPPHVNEGADSGTAPCPQVGFCPQTNAIFEHLTGREVLRFYAAARGYLALSLPPRPSPAVSPTYHGHPYQH
jgi:hypothetical protein